MVDTSEGAFEEAVVEGLKSLGWVQRASAYFDAQHCLDPDALFAFLQATQPSQWEKLKKVRGDGAKQGFLDRLSGEIATRGLIDVLRSDVEDLGCRFRLAYFRPSSKLSQEQEALYRQNTLSVVRQVRHSPAKGETVDVVLFLNGVPVATIELKTPLKGQTWQDAVKQYRARDPMDTLFRPGRCVAHFAADTDEVHVAPMLRGKDTVFLPFNKGNEGGKGNPPNPGGYRTSYFWQEILTPDSLLDILTFFVLEENRGKPTHELVFPRFHQLQAVRLLAGHARLHGPGHSYLLQHSAGSGKSKTIAWTAHRLVELADDQGKRVFDTVIVLTDRRQLDEQLRATVQSFEQRQGVVTAIDTSKAKKLAEALQSGAQIVVTTIQTFPFVAAHLEEIPERRFALLIDEAHSSQTGETARRMDETLAARPPQDTENEEESETEEDRINRAIEDQMRRRGEMTNVSYLAFTATPKPKTLELFGSIVPGTKERVVFSLYPMRQAIEEGFILDVLRNYTTFQTYYQLLKTIQDDPAYDRSAATAMLKAFVGLNEVTIERKARIMLEHFEGTVTDRVGGLAKAMVVTSSRLAAVRYMRVFRRLLKEMRLNHGVLVAFSGTVKDIEAGEEYTEAGLNGFPDDRTAEEFKKPGYRFLIVAEKFQTGFDEKLLHTMYVDKKLEGVNAVQTLSRLNRVHPLKRDTMVLDFANDVEAIQESFQPFYQATILSRTTDPNRLYDLRREIAQRRLYGQSEVDAFAVIYFSKEGTQEQLHAVLDPVVVRYEALTVEDRREFRKLVVQFVNLYAFLSHILPFKDASLEKTYQFLRLLRTKLRLPADRLPREVLEAVDLGALRVKETSSGSIKLIAEDGELVSPDEGTRATAEAEREALSEILRHLNEAHGSEIRDVDKIRKFMEETADRMRTRTNFANAMDPEVNPSEQNRWAAFKEFFEDAMEDMVDTNFEIYKTYNEDPAFAKMMMGALFARFASQRQPGSGTRR